MRTLFFAIAGAAILFLFSSCAGCSGSEEKVFQLYTNDFYTQISPAKEAGITGFILKAKNPHKRTMLVPFTLYHQIHSSLLVYANMGKDSNTIVITCYGSGFVGGLGYDTLLTNETQRYFTPIDMVSYRGGNVEIVCFEYCFLEDASSPQIEEEWHQECFFVYENDEGKPVIRSARSDFNPWRDSVYYLHPPALD